MNQRFALPLVSIGALTLPVHADDQPVTEMATVEVTAPMKAEAPASAVPVTVLTGEDLQLKIGHSIGETLNSEAGVTSQSFGPGVGMPVIRGQTGPRVRVLNNAIGSNDVSQLSPDHAVSVEPILAERIEVLRGPSTLRYGSGAIGGVVNVIDNRIPEQTSDRLVGGAFAQRYDSAANESTTALKIEGGKSHLAYHLDGFYRDRDNLSIGGMAIDELAAYSIDPTLPVPLQNSHGVLPNTSAHAISGSAGLSLVGDPGFAGVAINRLENNYGVPPDGGGGPNVRIDLQQTKYDFNSELIQPLSWVEALRMRLGYTDYQHTEYDGALPGTAYSSQTYEGRMELVHQALGPLHGSVGFQAIASDFSAVDFGGLKTIVPNSQINSEGVFAVESFALGPVNYQVGARVEQTAIAPQNHSSFNYTPVSASASGLWNINDHHGLSLAVTRSQRAPQVQELLTHGFHDATRSYELGDAALDLETSYNLDLGYTFKADWAKAELNVFHNWVNNYIYQQRTGQFVYQDPVTGDALPCGTHQNCSPVVQTRQADATFKGFESKLMFNLMENRHGLVDLTLFGDYTRGEFANGNDVPRMPPLRYGFQLEYALDAWTSALRLTRGEAQNHPGVDDTNTPGYVLLNLSTQYQLKDFHEAKLLVFAKGNNLLNDNIRNSTSYLRNFAPEPGRGAEIGIRMSY